MTFSGYAVKLAEDSTETLEKIAGDRPDLAILNVMMPKLDGLGVCHRLRSEDDDLPVMMLAARDSISEHTAGLDAGTDDCLSKPFTLEELLACARSLLRQSALEVPAMGDAATLQPEDLSLNPEIHGVFRGERRISLTRIEFTLLELLTSNLRRVLSRTAILGDVQGYDFPTSGNVLEIHTDYLRRKTGAEGRPCLIHTARGVDYMMRKTAP